MKKLWLLILALCLTSCAPDYSYSAPETTSKEQRENFVLEEITFPCDYYKALGEAGLEKLAEGSPILGLVGRYGSLLYANTPTGMIFIHEAEEFVWKMMEYNKLTGQFAPACHDVMCAHNDCLYSETYIILAGQRHLFFYPRSGDWAFYMSDPDGSDLTKLSLSPDAHPHAETEDGLYWEKTELRDGQAYYSLWFYAFSTGESRQIAAEAQNQCFYVTGDGIFIHDLLTLTLYKLNPQDGEKQRIAEDIVTLSVFGGSLYDYDYKTGIFRKLVSDEMVSIACIPGICDYWISDGYLYYFCEDRAYIESLEKDEELYQYLTEDNPTCGSIYRCKEGEDTPQLLCRITHDGKPALIDNLIADGQVLYIQCRDYQSFPNRYNDKRDDPMLVIYDATSGKLLEIPN